MAISVEVGIEIVERGGIEIDGQRVDFRAFTRRVQFLTQGDDQVCPICSMQHGRVSELDDPTRPQPPLHHKCRCEERWFVDGDSEPSRPMGARLRELLDGMSRGEAQEFLGKGRFRLLEAGMVTIGQLVEGNSAQLRSLTNLVETFRIPEHVLKRLGISKVPGAI